MEKVLAQDSFRMGMFRGVARHRIPLDGCYDLYEFLLSGDDGEPYKRGGSQFLTGVSGDPDPALAIWDGRTVAGDRTIIVDYAGDVWLVNSTDTTLTRIASTIGVGKRVKFSESDGVVVISGDGTATTMAVFAGGTKPTSYATGTVTVTNTSKVVTGAGTAWLANVEKGMIFAPIGGRWGIVESVDSNTQITLRYPWGGATTAGMNYGIASVSGFTPQNLVATEFVAGRLVGSSPSNRTRVAFEDFLATGEPDHTGALPATNYHMLPGEVNGIHALRDVALVFTSAGLFSIRGMAFDLTDAAGNPQQTVEKIDGMQLWSQMGVQAWQNALIVPARDGVYLVDGLSRPVLLSRSITGLWRDYIALAYQVGQAFVHRNVYCVPIVYPATGDVVEWLTCRLDGGDPDSGYWPWTRLSPAAARCGTVRRRPGEEPKLLGGSSIAGARLMRLHWFDPAWTNPNDADGGNLLWQFISRDFPTGTGARNTVRKARLTYTLTDPGAVNPLVQVTQAGEDGIFPAPANTGPEGDPGSLTWRFNKRARYIRFRASAAGGDPATASIRAIEGWARVSGKD